MALRNSFVRRPPFPFSVRARALELVCEPRGYIRAWREDGRPYWAPCLAWAPGPVSLASTGDGQYPTLFGRAWLLQMCQDGSWVLYQRDGTETLQVVPWDVVPPFGGITARHVTLAFDQAARPAIAWEEADGIRLREYDENAGQYAFVGPFPGCDPALLMDATINFRIPGSDVVLFYLSTDRTKLYYRVQSENFVIEHEHVDFEQVAVLDRSDLEMLRYQLTFALEDGEQEVIDGSPQSLRSLLYPYYALDHQGASIGNYPAAEFTLVVTVRTADVEALATVVGNFAGADYHAVIIVRTPDPEALTASLSNYAAADNAQVVVLVEPDMEALTAVVGNYAAASNALVVILREPPAEALTATVSNFPSAEYA